MSSGERERSRAFAIRMSPAQVAKQAVQHYYSELHRRDYCPRMPRNPSSCLVLLLVPLVSVAQKKLECNHPE